jgi:preprotein translocase subunit SecA
MFGAMMDSIREEAVGFLFHLEVEVEAHDEAPVTVESASETAQLGQALLDVAAGLAAAEDSGEPAAPQITAKGLEREHTDRPMIYSAPELGSDAPSVTTDGGSSNGSSSADGRRQAARSNPNRGNRGNKPRRKR